MSAVGGIVYLLGRESPYLPPVNSNDDLEIPPSNICSPRLKPKSRVDRVSEFQTPSSPLDNNDHLDQSRLRQTRQVKSEGNNNMPERDHNVYTTMSSDQRTPLLGQRNHNANSREGKHAIFLRVCHSPWSGISQRLLTVIRGLLAIYLVTTFFLVMLWQCQEKDHKHHDGEGGGGKHKDGRGGKGDGKHDKDALEVLKTWIDPLSEEMVDQFFKITMVDNDTGKNNETSGDDREVGDLQGQTECGWISIFRFETISLFIQALYAVITFEWCHTRNVLLCWSFDTRLKIIEESHGFFRNCVGFCLWINLWAMSLAIESWTLMHLVSHRHNNTGIDSLGAKIKKFFSHPTGSCAFFFSLFYTAAVSFPHVVVLVYWTIIVPARNIDVDDLFCHGPLQTFAILNLYLFGSIIALLEIFFLSSVRRPGPSYSHILGLTFFAVQYFLWATVGHYFTGKWVYYFLNYKKEGWENVFVALLAFISLLNIFYGFIYGLTGIREAIIDGEEGHGHARLRGTDGTQDEEGLEYDQYRDADPENPGRYL